jgi:methylmalonyl-CoA/ethylmalonyl-CoA epimerase
MNSESKLIFHHIGLLTDDLPFAAKRLERLGYIIGVQIDDPLQKVTLQMCEPLIGGAKIELVSPKKENDGLFSLLRRRGDYMYHICFSAPSFKEAENILRLDGGDRIVLVSEPKPAILFNNLRVAFYLVSGLGLVEILETDKLIEEV